MSEQSSPAPASRRERVLSALGWVGMGMVVAAFATKTFGWSDAGVLYFVLNALGSLLLCASNLARANFQSLSLNGIWAAVALYSLAELLP